jgi:hypothetical protein
MTRVLPFWKELAITEKIQRDLYLVQTGLKISMAYSDLRPSSPTGFLHFFNT